MQQKKQRVREREREKERVCCSADIYRLKNACHAHFYEELQNGSNSNLFIRQVSEKLDRLTISRLLQVPHICTIFNVYEINLNIQVMCTVISSSFFLV